MVTSKEVFAARAVQFVLWVGMVLNGLSFILLLFNGGEEWADHATHSFYNLVLLLLWERVVLEELKDDG